MITLIPKKILKDNLKMEKTKLKIIKQNNSKFQKSIMKISKNILLKILKITKNFYPNNNNKKI